MNLTDLINGSHKMILSFKLMSSDKEYIKNYEDYLESIEYSIDYPYVNEYNNKTTIDNIKGIIEYYKEEFTKAKSLFLQAVIKNDINGMINIAYLFENIDKNDELANRYYLFALKNGYRNIFYDVGNYYYSIGDYQKSIKHYQFIIDKAIHNNSTDIMEKVIRKLIIMIYDMEKVAHLILELEKYADINSEECELIADYYRTKVTNGRDIYKAIEYYEKSGNNLYYKLALCYKEIKDIDEEKRYLKLALGLEENYELILNELSIIPNLSDVDNIIIANSYFKYKHYDKAIIFYSKLDSIVPNLGWSYIHIGKLEEGLQYLTNANSNIDIGLFYQRYSNPIDIEKAKEYYLKVIEPLKIHALLQLIEIENDKDLLINYFREIIKSGYKGKFINSLYTKLSYLLIEKKDDEMMKEAKVYLNIAILNKYVPAMLVMGDLYEFHDINYENSIMYYSLANNAIAYNNIACIYRDKYHDNDKAKKYFNLASDLGSEKAKMHLSNFDNKN